MLKNLESKVREQDAYWTKVVLMKDNEIEKLKPISEKSWAGKCRVRQFRYLPADKKFTGIIRRLTDIFFSSILEIDSRSHVTRWLSHPT